MFGSCEEDRNIPVLQGPGVESRLDKVEFAPSTHPTTGGSYAASPIFEQ